ncbi:hypothetical protein, partial [Thermococcus sibiricus]
MKARKIIALGVGALVAGGLGAVAAQNENVYAGLNIEKAVIAFPTTAEVDGQVVHVKEDGLAAARLALTLFQDSITSTEVEVKATDTHMTEAFQDDDSEWWFNAAEYVPDFEEFPIDVVVNNQTPTGDDVGIWFNWTLFDFNTTTNITTIVSNDTAQAIKIYIGEERSPFAEFKGAEGVSSADGSVKYYYMSKTSEPLQTYEVGVPVTDIKGWDITFIDYEITPEKRALVQLKGPGASDSDLVIIEKDNWTVIWVDDNGNNMVKFFGTNETAADAKVTALKKDGVEDILKLKIGDTFFGVLGSQYIYVDWTQYWYIGEVEKNTNVGDNWIFTWDESKTWL